MILFIFLQFILNFVFLSPVFAEVQYQFQVSGRCVYSPQGVESDPERTLRPVEYQRGGVLNASYTLPEGVEICYGRETIPLSQEVAAQIQGATRQTGRYYVYENASTTISIQTHSEYTGPIWRAPRLRTQVQTTAQSRLRPEQDGLWVLKFNTSAGAQIDASNLLSQPVVDHVRLSQGGELYIVSLQRDHEYRISAGTIVDLNSDCARSGLNCNARVSQTAGFFFEAYELSARGCEQAGRISLEQRDNVGASLCALHTGLREIPINGSEPEIATRSLALKLINLRALTMRHTENLRTVPHAYAREVRRTHNLFSRKFQELPSSFFKERFFCHVKRVFHYVYGVLGQAINLENLGSCSVRE